MNFRFANVAELNHDAIIERCDRLPVDLHPVCLGSGEIGVAVDATGLQGLNAWQTQMADTLSIMHPDQSTNWNLYIHRDQALSQHHSQPGTDYYRLMPCGWLDYVLTIDGRAYDAYALVEHARDWERAFRPKTGILTTSYTVGPVRLKLQTGIAPDAVVVACEFEFKCDDGQPHDVAVEVRCHQTLRDGRPLARAGMETGELPFAISRRWAATSSNSTAKLLEPITLTWEVNGDQFTVTDEYIGGRRSAQSVTGTFRFDVLADSDRAPDAGRAGGLAAVRAGWEKFFTTGAEVWLGEPDKEFLYLQQQYVLKAGESFHGGIVLGTLWNEEFGGSTFFDSLSACEGMLRTGHVAEIRAFCEWVTRVMPRKGRPFYHMTYYTGQPAGTNEEVFQVCLAYGAVAVRLYEFTRDRRDLEQTVFPYMYRLAEYLLAEKLAETPAGWQFTGQYCGDSHLPPEDLTKETGLFAWTATLLAKTAEYAAALGVENPVIARCRSLRDFVTRTGPIKLDDLKAWSNWFPYLANRAPFLDFPSYRAAVQRRYPELGRPCIDYMPWGHFSFAMSALLTGHGDAALQELETGCLMICGLGYLDESMYEMRGGGFAPYPPATGSYLATVTNLIVDGGLFDDDLRIGTVLPKFWQKKYLKFRNLCTVNGARVSGEITPYSVDLTIQTDRPRRAEIALPMRVAGEPVICRSDAPVASEGTSEKEEETAKRRGRRFYSDGRVVQVELPVGATRVTIERDLTTPHDALVIEPMQHGEQVCALLRGAGLSVRWLRDYPTLPRVIEHARLIFIHTSYTSLPVEVVRELERAARRGARVVCLFHSGRLDVDGALAELSGVRATQPSNHWEYDSTPHTYRLTARGREVLPGLPGEFAVPQTAEFVLNPTPDLEALATDAGSGQPVVTRRPVGQGWVCWIAAGNKSADGPQYAYTASTNEILNHGFDYEARQKRLWLQDTNWQKLFVAVATSNWSERKTQ